MSEIENVPVRKLKCLHNVQPREEIDGERVQAMAELLMEDPEFQFEPGKAFRNPRNGDLLVADGFTRRAAYEVAERHLMPMDIEEGDEGDASWYALSANARHGKPLTTSETHLAIGRALEHRNRKDMSQEQLAKMLGISARTIRRHVEEHRPKPKKSVERGESEPKEKFSAEVIEAIDKIGECLPNAKIAILNGSIKKPEDELIAFAELDCETQTKLASYFFTADLSLKGAINAATKRPADVDSAIRDYINYTQLKGVGQTWYFFGDSVSVEICLLIETKEEAVTKVRKPVAVPEGLI